MWNFWGIVVFTVLPAGVGEENPGCRLFIQFNFQAENTSTKIARYDLGYSGKKYQDPTENSSNPPCVALL